MTRLLTSRFQRFSPWAPRNPARFYRARLNIPLLKHPFPANSCPQANRFPTARVWGGAATRVEWVASLRSVEPARLRRCPAFGQQWGLYRKGFFIQVGEYLLDDYRIFNAGDHFDATAAGTARLNVDIEHPLETLGPSHGRATFSGRSVLRLIRRFGLTAFATLCRRHLHAMLAVGGEYSVEAGKVNSWLRHQGGQSGDEVQRAICLGVPTLAMALSPESYFKLLPSFPPYHP